MRQWHEARYFTPDLPIKLKHWQGFHPLGVVFRDADVAFHPDNVAPEPQPPNRHGLGQGLGLGLGGMTPSRSADDEATQRLLIQRQQVEQHQQQQQQQQQHQQQEQEQQEEETYHQHEEKKDETKELILKRCAVAVQQVWPDCLSEAQKLIEKEVENILHSVGFSYEGIIDNNGFQNFFCNTKIKDLIVRCIGGLLLFRDTKGKWMPQYAEPVLVAVASGICEGCSVQDYRLMMSTLGDILSNI